MSTIQSERPVESDRTQHRPPEQPWRLVAAREMSVKLHDRNFLIGTVVTMLLIAAAVAMNAFLSTRGSTTTIAVSSTEAKSVAEAVGAAMHQADDSTTVTVHQVADDMAAEGEVNADKADVVLRRSGEGWQLVSKGDPSNQVATYTRAVVSQQVLAATAAKAGSTPEQVNAQTVVSTKALSTSDDQRKLTGMIVGGVFAVLFYMASIMFGMQIAQSVIEEKQSRIVEILAAAIPVRHLLAGKVVGNTVMAVGQIVIYVGLGVVGLSLTPLKDMLPAVSTGMAWGLAFFLAGFLALACLWAVAGSLATRNEDLQQTSTPMSMVLMLGFFASFMAKGAWLTGLSFVPVLSSMLMPSRLVSGDASWWEGVVALALTGGFAAVTMILGERMYRRSLMQTSSRMTFREALRATD